MLFSDVCLVGCILPFDMLIRFSAVLLFDAAKLRPFLRVNFMKSEISSKRPSYFDKYQELCACTTLERVICVRTRCT